YDLEVKQKTELLIILTPRVIRSEEDADQIKQIESARISWVLSDVEKMHGVIGMQSRWDSVDCHDTPTIYPDTNPRGELIEEHVVEREGVPRDKVTPTVRAQKPPTPPAKPVPGAPGTPGAKPGPVGPYGPQRPPMSGGGAIEPGAAQSVQPPPG